MISRLYIQRVQVTTETQRRRGLRRDTPQTRDYKPFSLTATCRLLLDSRSFMERRLKLRGWSRYKASPRARASSLALLCLVAHALFVCVTHHHDRPSGHESLATVSFTAEEGDSSSTPDSSNESNCLSCRLQRNFVSNVNSSSLAIELPQEALLRENVSTDPHSYSCLLLLSGRSPPLA